MISYGALMQVTNLVLLFLVSCPLVQHPPVAEEVRHVLFLHTQSHDIESPTDAGQVDMILKIAVQD